MNDSCESGQPAHRWIVAQEGSRQTYAVPIAFFRLEMLRLMYVDIWCSWGRSWLRRGPAKVRALATRFHPEIPSDHIVSFTGPATLWRAAQNLRRRKLSRREMSDEFCSFGRWYARQVGRHLSRFDLDPESDRFLGFNSNCLETLELLKDRQIFTVLDQVDPGLVEENIVLEEAERWPRWEGIPGRMSPDYWDRVKAEWAAASLVLVNSNWSRDALVQQGVPAQKIIIVPLAIDLKAEHELKPVNPKGPLKVLWLGSVILRKGIQYLVEAARKLERHQVEFLLAGPLGISDEAVRSFPANIKVLGRITRDQLSAYYRQAHLFVLPTLSDGFAITQLEAMAHGLPVVTTPHCGNVVTDGVDGFIVPARDSQALADAIARLDADRDQLYAMSCNTLLSVQKYDLPSNAKLINDLVVEHRRSLQGKSSLDRSPARILS
jgi:glycosyltransferase involved in cell wall biosynthesis